MNVSIILKKGLAVLQNRETFPLTADPVVLSFSTSAPGDLKNLFIKGTINSLTVAFDVGENGVAVLPAALKQCGVLTLSVFRIINGAVYETWSVEPIRFIEIEGEYTAIPQIIDMQAKILEQSQKINDLAAAVAELKNLITNKEF